MDFEILKGYGDDIKHWWQYKPTVSKEKKLKFLNEAFDTDDAMGHLRIYHPASDDLLYGFNQKERDKLLDLYGWNTLRDFWKKNGGSNKKEVVLGKLMRIESDESKKVALEEMMPKKYVPIIQLPEAGPKIPIIPKNNSNIESPQIPYSSEAVLIPRAPALPLPDYSTVGVPLLRGEMYLIDHSRKPFDFILQKNFKGSGRIDPFLKVK